MEQSQLEQELLTYQNTDQGQQNGSTKHRVPVYRNDGKSEAKLIQVIHQHDASKKEAIRRNRYYIDIGSLSVLKEAPPQVVPRLDLSRSPPKRDVSPVSDYYSQAKDVPVNKATFMLTEIQQQEKIIKNRINYLATREDRILKELEEK